MNRSCRTVKADAAGAAFSAVGEEIVWAVVDSGIQGDHPHFAKYENIVDDPSLMHRDFTVSGAAPERPLVDEFGHGTHVAGIIAGEQEGTKKKPIFGVTRYRDKDGEVTHQLDPLPRMSGMAPALQAAEPQGPQGGRQGRREQHHLGARVHPASSTATGGAFASTA